MPPRGYYVEMAARAAAAVADCCHSLGLRCADAPAASSRLLYDLGYSQYLVRSFWHGLKALCPLRLPLYRFRGASFYLEARVVEDGFTEAYCGGLHVPLGSRARAPGAVQVPRGLLLRLHLAGGVGDSRVSINVVRLLTLLRGGRPGLFKALVEAVVEAGWGRPRPLLEIVDTVVEQLSTVLGIVVPLPAKGCLQRWIPILEGYAEQYTCR